MKPEELKLYQKYKWLEEPTEYIYIGKNTQNNIYYFLFSHNPINNILTKEFFIERNLNFKPILKDKLKNIINR